MTVPPETTRLRRAADLATRVALPVAVFAVVLALFLGEEMSIDHELQLVAPSEVEPGGELAVQALLLDELGEVDGPRLVSGPVRLRLSSPDGTVRARKELAASPAGGAAGFLTVPADLRGPMRLTAVAFVDGEAVASVRAPLRVTEAPAEARLRGHMTGASSDLQLDRVFPVGTETPPSSLDVRVAGGACVPESRCDLLVRVGSPAASVHARPSRSATPGEPSPAGPTEGLVRVPVTVHGPEAEIELVAARAGQDVATRTLQLPVVLATPGLQVEERIDGGRPSLSVAVLGDRPGIIVDAYQHGLWRRTGAVPDARAQSFESPVGTLSPGVWRLQVRTDPFSAERAAIRLVVVRGHGVTFQTALTSLVERRGPPPPSGEPPELSWAYAAAPFERSVRTLPAPVSGLSADLERLHTRQTRLRIAAVIAMVLGLLVAAVVLLRRGLDAALQAQQVMDATGDPELASRRHRRRTLLSALVIVATLLLAFLGAAALIVARAHLLE